MPTCKKCGRAFKLSRTTQRPLCRWCRPSGGEHAGELPPTPESLMFVLKLAEDNGYEPSCEEHNALQTFLDTEMADYRRRFPIEVNPTEVQCDELSSQANHRLDSGR